MDIRKIKNFISVVDAGSIARAAGFLHIAQPALSTQMRQLEDSMKAELLSRSSRGVVPTAAGLELVHKGRQLLRMFDAVMTIGQDMAASPEGHVNIGLPASIGAAVSLPIMQATAARYPAITLGLQELTSATIGSALISGQLDVAILFDDALASAMRHEAIFDEDLFLVGRDIEQDEIPVARLRDRPIVMPARPNSMRLLLDRACAKRDFIPKVIADVSSPHTMLQLAATGITHTILPGAFVSRGLPAGLRASRIVAPRLTRTVCLATHSQTPLSARVSAVARIARNALTSIGSPGMPQSPRVHKTQKQRRRAATGST